MHAIREPGAGLPGLSGAAAVAPREPRHTRARVDLGAFAANLALARRLAGPGRGVLAVVKADAYGHGAVPVARAAAAAGAAALGVATAEEGAELRGAGLALPILVLAEVPPRQADAVVAQGLAQTVYTEALATALEEAAGRAGRRVAVHLKVDTGMGRVGVHPGEAGAFARLLRGLPHLELEGLMTHLADAERPGGGRAAAQLAAFSAAGEAVRAACGPLRWTHAANSALLMRGLATGNLVRPGIMLYGCPPGPGLPHAGELRPALSLETRVAFLKRVPAGTPLSYGGTHVTARESLVATLPVGYADGYRRGLSNRGAVLVRGRRAPVVGTVCMDMCLADVTEVPGVDVGDEVVLVGRQGGEEISATEVGDLLGTISYEVLCGIGRRVPRVHGAGGRAGEEGP